MEASLMFDVLLYLNLFYFPVFLVCEGCVVFGKYISPNLWTPNIGKDAAVMAVMVTSEFIKLVIHRKFKDTRKCKYKNYFLVKYSKCLLFCSDGKYFRYNFHDYFAWRLILRVYNRKTSVEH